MKVFRIYDIDWNTDGEIVDLPSEVNIEIEYDNGEEVGTTLSEEAIDWVSNQLSDSFDWLVDGFEYEESVS